jgi:hypothetical protein
MRVMSEARAFLAVLALSSLVALSCTKPLGDGPASGGDNGSDNGSITTTKPTSFGSAPAPAAAAGLPAGAVVVPTSTNPEAAPATPIETPAALPSPAVLQAVSTAQGRLDGLAASVSGTKVRFVDCNETSSCTTRLEAQSLTALRDLLQAVSKEQGGMITFVAREQMDAYTGRTFTADVTLGAKETKAVPTDENELLAN